MREATNNKSKNEEFRQIIRQLKEDEELDLIDDLKLEKRLDKIIKAKGKS